MIEEVCVATGGAWLPNRQVSIADGAVELIGIERPPARFQTLTGRLQPVAGPLSVLVSAIGRPAMRSDSRGHTHGGQVRVPSTDR